MDRLLAPAHQPRLAPLVQQHRYRSFTMGLSLMLSSQLKRESIRLPNIKCINLLCSGLLLITLVLITYYELPCSRYLWVILASEA